MKFVGSLSTEDGRLVFRRVEGEITITPTATVGVESWNGHIELTGERIRSERYTLTLDDGRSGSIEIGPHTISTKPGCVAPFAGTFDSRPKPPPNLQTF